MSILALVKKAEEIPQVVSWAAHFALARETSLKILCWRYAPVLPSGGFSSHDDLVAAVRELVEAADQTGALSQLAEGGGLEIRQLAHPNAAVAAINAARDEQVDLIVAASEDPSGTAGATYATNALLRNAPCHTVVLFGGSGRSTTCRDILVDVTDSAHDVAAVFLANLLAEKREARVTLARTESDYEQEAFEVGRRELRSLMRDAGIQDTDRITCRVFRSGDYAEIAAAMDEQDLVLTAANNQQVHTLLELTSRPTVAVIKRAPALRAWRRAARNSPWNPRLSPADYADLIEGLRRGSRLSVDYLTMAALAAVVASMGLLQDSPAVVIGSMLLAPLMTPMLGCGLALAQANPKLGNSALRSVAIGLACTLAISFVLGVLTPGAELTPQIYARGDPDVLDLIIAVASGAAAAYALARPNLVGSIAGVAIATALVPPLCSVGLSLAYGEFLNALGAAVLFATNFVAIVLSAVATFRLMGVTATGVETRHRKWVFRTAAALGLAAIVLFIPLQQSLLEGVVWAKPQPTSYPLARSVMDALKEHIQESPDVELLSAGVPSSPHDPSDVVVVLGAPRELDPAYAQELIDVVRHEMKSPDLVVEVHCIRELWQETAR